MAHRARIRTIGTWIGVVSTAEFQAFDDAQFSSPDFDAGGTWAPAAQIIIGGAGVSLTGDSFLSSCKTLTVVNGGGGVSFGTTVVVALNHLLNVASGALIEVLSGGAIEIASGGALLVDGGASMGIAVSATLGIAGLGHVQSGGAFAIDNGGTFAVSSGGAANFANGSTSTWFNGSTSTWQSGASATFAAGSAVTFAGTTALGGTVNQSATVTRSGPELLSGSAAQTAWRHGIAHDADHDYDASKDGYLVPAFSANHTYVVKDNGAGGTVTPQVGQRLKFSKTLPTDAHTLVFHRDDGSTIAQFPASAAWWVEMEYFDDTTGGGTMWHAIGWSSNAVVVN